MGPHINGFQFSLQITLGDTSDTFYTALQPLEDGGYSGITIGGVAEILSSLGIGIGSEARFVRMIAEVNPEEAHEMQSIIVVVLDKEHAPAGRIGRGSFELSSRDSGPFLDWRLTYPPEDLSHTWEAPYNGEHVFCVKD